MSFENYKIDDFFYLNPREDEERANALHVAAKGGHTIYVKDCFKALTHLHENRIKESYQNQAKILATD